MEISNPKPNDSDHGGFKPRHGIDRDLKFYQNLNLYVDHVSIKNENVEILRSQLQMWHRKCIISNHPYIPDEIIDINIPFLNVSIRPSVLQLILYLDTLNLLSPEEAKEEEKEEIKEDRSKKRTVVLGIPTDQKVDPHTNADEKAVKREL